MSKSKLEMEIRHHDRQTQTLFLSRLFGGALRPNDIEEKLLQLGWLDQVWNWSSMIVLSFQVDTLEDTHYESKNLSLLLFAVSNIVEEIIACNENGSIRHWSL